MEANKASESYFGRCAVLRSRLASHGTIFSDTDAHHHLVQNLLFGGTLMDRFDIGSPWGLYKLHKTPWFCLMSG